MRLFIGIATPPDSAILALLDELARAEQSQPGIKAVPAENLHVTLRFLGEVREEKVQAIIAALETALAHERSFDLQIGQPGSFANALWLQASAPGLAGMAKRLDQALSTIGFEPERRPYRPHVTLARLQPIFLFDVLGWLERHEQHEPYVLRVDQVHLYRSVPVPGGVRYESVYTLDLAGPAVSQAAIRAAT